jgi:hypothetical protein
VSPSKKIVSQPTDDHQESNLLILDEAPPWPRPMTRAAFYGLAGKIVDAIAPHTEADPAAMLVQLLVRLGTLFGREVFTPVGATRHHLNNNALIVGETSGGRKGQSADNMDAVIQRVAALTPAARVETQSGLSSGEGLIHAVRDPSRMTDPAKGKVDDPGVKDKRLFVLESEFASPLKVMEREGNTLSPTLRNAWDGKTLQTLTRTAPMKATTPHISIVGHITPDELRRMLTHTEAVNGFANRMLFVCSRRTRLLPDGGWFPRQELEPLADEIAAIVEAAQPGGELTRDDSARDLWHHEYPHLTRDVPGLVGAVIARRASHVLRLSAVYALLDWSWTIRVEHVEAALAVWQYCEESVRHIFGDALGDPDADMILRALRNVPDGLTRDEIARQLFQKNRAKWQLDASLNVLVTYDLARCESDRSGQRGRPAERWFATRQRVAA